MCDILSSFAAQKTKYFVSTYLQSVLKSIDVSFDDVYLIENRARC